MRLCRKRIQLKNKIKDSLNNGRIFYRLDRIESSTNYGGAIFFSDEVSSDDLQIAILRGVHALLMKTADDEAELLPGERSG